MEEIEHTQAIIMDKPPVKPVAGFDKAWVIMDLIFCSLGLPRLLLRLITLWDLEKFDYLYLAMVIAFAGMIFIGLTADILLLFQRKTGLILGWIALLLLLLDLAVGCGQATLCILLPFGIAIYLWIAARVAVNAVYAFVLLRIGRKFKGQAAH